MFNDSDNGQTQYCKECLKKQERIDELENILKDIKNRCQEVQQEYANILEENRSKYGKERDEEIITWKQGRSYEALMIEGKIKNANIQSQKTMV